MAAGVQRCDFSATMNAQRTISAYSLAYFLFFISPLSRHNMPYSRYRLVPALLVDFYEPQSTMANTSAGKTAQTTVHPYGRLSYKWLLYVPANRESDLQGNYHALIREYTARETLCCITLLLPSSV